MKNYIIILYCCFSLTSVAQIVPTLDSLNSILKIQHTLLLEAEITEFQDSKKFNWLYFLPNLGYDFINNRPFLTFNFSGVSSLIKNKQTTKSKITSLEKKQVLSVKQELSKLTLKYNNLNFMVKQLEFKIEIFADYKDLFYIKEQQYKKNEITLEEYIKEKIYIKEKAQSIYVYFERIDLKVLDLTNSIKQGVEVNLPVFDFTL